MQLRPPPSSSMTTSWPLQTRWAISLVFLSARLVDPPVKGQIRLAWEEIMGYVARIACTAFVNDVIVFAIFLVVCPTSAGVPFFSEGIVQNRYFPIGYQLWWLYGEWGNNPPCHTRSRFTDPDTVSYNTTFHQRVSVVSRIWFYVCVAETGPSCMSIIWKPLEQPSFTRACYRCDKTAFFQALVSTEILSVAQVVLTLRSVSFSRDGFILITAEWNRIYAITRKNWAITLCLCAITISQFILGLYITAYLAKRGGKPVTKSHPQFSPAMFQWNPSYQSHFRFTWYA